MSRSSIAVEGVFILKAPTITSLPEGTPGSVIVSGSHGGIYPGYCAAKGQVRAVVFHDAGVGMDQAGIGSLNLLQNSGIAAATVSSASCRIGDPEDMLRRGSISYANSIATALGVKAGMDCCEAAERLTGATWSRTIPEALGEARSELSMESAKRQILLLDSAALVQPHDEAQIIVTGSHGALVGGNPAMALRVGGFAAVFHDAGGGVEGAGYTRLPALDERGIAAFTVSASTARIGDARSVYASGIISAVNRRATELGARVGDKAQDTLQHWAFL